MVLLRPQTQREVTWPDTRKSLLRSRRCACLRVCRGRGPGDWVTTRRQLIVVLGAGALAEPLASFAQQRGKLWRIGVLETTSMESNAVNFDAFKTGMRELGYVEGKDFRIEYRSADGRTERFRD